MAPDRLLRVLAASIVAVAATVSLVAAQPDDVAQKKAAAEAAFRQGKALIDTDTAGACAAFKQSMALDPQFGTQYNLALCYQKLGKLASAWGELIELAATDANAARRADSASRAKALEPRLMRLLIVIKARVPGMKVMRDDSDVTAFMGVATPVDPGMSKLTASAPGYKPWTQDISVSGDGSTTTVEIPELEKLPDPPPDLEPDRGNGLVVGPVTPPPPKDPGKIRRVVGIALGGVGVAGIGAGVFFGLAARSSFAAADEECGGDVGDCRGDTELAAADVDSARTKAMMSNIGLGVGAAALIGGVVLYLTAPRLEGAPSITPAFGDGTAGVVVTGRF
jgi:hypothetical protein